MLAGSGTDLALAEWAGSIARSASKSTRARVLIQAAAARLLKAPQRTADYDDRQRGGNFFLQIRTVRFLIIYSFWRQDGAKGCFYSDSPPAGAAQRDSFDFLRRNPACDARKRTKRGNSIMQKEKVTACKKRRFLLQFPIATRCR
jgi:hypothetical protein